MRKRRKRRRRRRRRRKVLLVDPFHLEYHCYQAIVDTLDVLLATKQNKISSFSSSPPSSSSPPPPPYIMCH